MPVKLRLERHINLKNARGRPMHVVRELYLREDIPCRSVLCSKGCKYDPGESLSRLPDGLPYYIIPDCGVARDYLEVLETMEIQGIIFTQTATHSVQHEGGRRLATRLQNLVRNPMRGSIIFHNEFQLQCHCPREENEALEDWQLRCTIKAAKWFHNHLCGRLPIIILTNNPKAEELYGAQTEGVPILSLKDLVVNHGFAAQMPNILELYNSLTAALASRTRESEFAGYLPMEDLEAGIKSGKFLQGCLMVNRQNAQTEAFIRTTNNEVEDEEGLGSDVLIYGMAARNRALHGDSVVVELLPRQQWRGRSNTIRDPGEAGEVPDEPEEVMRTGKVIGVYRRNTRDYVASFSPDQELQGNSSRAERVLVVPWDYRIPKIRISTSQAQKLRDHRIVVRIDSWEAGSQYPNGHFVKSLGPIGQLETEVETLLIENSIRMPPYSDFQKKELPPESEPWNVDEAEVAKRKDLRESHLVFSIDPKGCEDVDDTLSIRELANGNLELGVHIADVTHFVRPGMMTDMEAKSRATSVYLADRRYDMLPPVLSANICSLVSKVDRYAVSVLWELTPDCKVVNVWFGRTVICSQYKLFYEIAQAMAEGAKDQECIENIPELQELSKKEQKRKLWELRAAVKHLMAVARQLRERRVVGGALELESVEVRVEMDDTSNIQELSQKSHLEIHDTIAECMIYANHYVAKRIEKAFPLQALLRHHPLPREEQFANLRRCAQALGFTVDTSSNKALADSLDACVDPKDPEVNKLLRMLATQAMSNAAYFSTGSLPHHAYFHYGLALDKYTHFTSPIRRYADILVHRQLLCAVGEDSVELPNNSALQEICTHINDKHRAAQHVQRDSQELFQALFFQHRPPEDEACTANAVIFQLKANGVLVFVPRYGIRGPVYLKSKEGQVIFAPQSGEVEWTVGSLSHSNTSVTVNSVRGSQTYCLFDHITVRMSVAPSRVHLSSLKLSLVHNQPHLHSPSSMGTASQQRTDIVKEVRSAAEERMSISDDDDDHDPAWEELRRRYGQTPAEHSAYTLFQNFFAMGLRPLPDKKDDKKDDKKSSK